MSQLARGPGRSEHVMPGDLGMEVKPTSLIVTLRMEASAAARFTASRQAHFPPDRNWLAAHITLFHALPVASIERVLTDAADRASATCAFSMRVERLLFLGRGVAYGIDAPPALRLRRDLADRWAPLLGRQDRAWPGRLHVTVQNKVEPATARALHDRLQRTFVPEEIGATGLEVWYYLGGPWQAAAAFDFAAHTGDPGPCGSTMAPSA